MARQTRAERRARREAQARSGRVERAHDRQAEMRPAVQPVKSQTGRRIPGSGTKRFVGESWGELKKVEWPNQSQVIQGTVVVIVACIIIGSYLYFADQVFSRFVTKILLGQ